jgi:hypothetical protein
VGKHLPALKEKDEGRVRNGEPIALRVENSSENAGNCGYSLINQSVSFRRFFLKRKGRKPMWFKAFSNFFNT